MRSFLSLIALASFVASVARADDVKKYKGGTVKLRGCYAEQVSKDADFGPLKDLTATVTLSCKNPSKEMLIAHGFHTPQNEMGSTGYAIGVLNQQELILTDGLPTGVKVQTMTTEPGAIHTLIVKGTCCRR